MKKSVWLIPVFSLIILAFTVHRGEVPRNPASAPVVTASAATPAVAVSPAVAKDSKAKEVPCPELLKKVTEKR